MELYRSTLPQISLSGPTRFSNIIQQQLDIIDHRKGAGDLYNILLIITDGEIHDMPETKDLIVRGSKTPLSIIIVGFGKENFSMMRELDSDGQPLRDSRGTSAIRDVVQFVKFQEFASQGPERLAQEVLAEIPDQFVSFMMSQNIMPHP